MVSGASRAVLGSNWSVLTAKVVNGGDADDTWAEELEEENRWLLGSGSS
jgi:hypothetical protein